MADENKGPYLVAAILCEKILQEQDGTISIIRMVDRLAITVSALGSPETMPPTPITLQALISLKSGSAKGRETIVVRTETPSGLSTSQVFGKNQSSNSRSEISSAIYEDKCSRISNSRGCGMSEPPIKRVDATELRKLFNESGYWEQYKTGHLQGILRKSKHPSPPLANDPLAHRASI